MRKGEREGGAEREREREGGREGERERENESESALRAISVIRVRCFKNNFISIFRN